MRKGWIITIAGVLAVIAAYSVYWHWAAGLLERNLAAWTAQWRAEGYRIEYALPDVRGFPLTLEADLGRLEIEAPSGERTWRWQPLSASLALTAAPWRPLAFSLALQGTHRLELIDGQRRRPVDVYVNEGSADIGLSLSGHPDAIVFGARLLEVSESGNMVRLEGVHGRATLFAAAPTDPVAPTASFDLSLDEASLPAPADLPIGDRLSGVAIQGQVMGAIPVGRVADALARWRDAGGTIELARLASQWGPLAVDGSGTLALDDAMQPLLAATASVEGYAEAIDAAVASGDLLPSQAVAAKVMLGAMARPVDGRPAVEVPLTIQDRTLFVGPLRLLELPRIEWW